MGDYILDDVIDMTMSSIGFHQKNNLKKKATSNIKSQRILSSLALNARHANCRQNLNAVAMYLGDGSYTFDVGTVTFHPTKGTYWVAYINQKDFDSLGYLVVPPPPQKISRFIIKRNGHG